jgi:UDP-GlcNAc:undecaprenyl-phosphate/decaprenyl-phosphate GlcNAc-1-phosphate transferase
MALIGSPRALEVHFVWRVGQTVVRVRPGGPKLTDSSDLSYLVVLLTVGICLYAGPISRRLGVVDMPDGDRKAHPEPTPMVGGIAILLPLCVWCAAQFFRGPPDDLYLTILICGGGLGVVGFMDDQHTISAGARLILLAMLSAVALKLDPALVTNRILVGGGWVQAPLYLIPVLSVVALMGFASAVNMADGTNGIVVALYLIWALCLVAASSGPVAAAAQVIAGAAFVTFMFNMRGRLFLGDCGTFAIGLVVGVLTILSHNAGRVSLETVIVWFFLPVMDCLRLIVVRAWQHRSPFRPDKNHFHHQLAKWIGDTGAFWTYICLTAATSFAATLRPHVAVTCIAILAVFYVGFQFADVLAPRLAVRAIASAKDGRQPGKVVFLKSWKR